MKYRKKLVMTKKIQGNSNQIGPKILFFYHSPGNTRDSSFVSECSAAIKRLPK